MQTNSIFKNLVDFIVLFSFGKLLRRMNIRKAEEDDMIIEWWYLTVDFVKILHANTKYLIHMYLQVFYLHTYVQTYAHLPTRMCSYIQIYTHIYANIMIAYRPTHIYANIIAYTSTHIHTPAHTYTHTHMHMYRLAYRSHIRIYINLIVSAFDFFLILLIANTLL